MRETMPAHTSCIVCDSPDVFRVVEIPPLPIDTNRLWASRADARAAAKARISLAHCNNCGHVFNCNYNDDLIDYEVDYENSQLLASSLKIRRGTSGRANCKARSAPQTHCRNRRRRR